MPRAERLVGCALLCCFVLPTLVQAAALEKKKRKRRKAPETPAAVYHLGIDDLLTGFEAGQPAVDLEAVRRSGNRRSFRGVGYDALWRGTLLVLMQRGLLAEVSRERGLVVCLGSLKVEERESAPDEVVDGFPMVVLIEPSEAGRSIDVYTDWLDGLLGEVEPGARPVGVTAETRARLSGDLLEMLAVSSVGVERWRDLFANESVQFPEGGDR